MSPHRWSAVNLKPLSPRSQRSGNLKPVFYSAHPNSLKTSAEMIARLRRNPSVSPPYVGTPVSVHQHLRMKRFPDRIQSCISTYFDGIIVLVDPEANSVGRWTRTCKPSPCSLTCPVNEYSHRQMCCRTRQGRVLKDVEIELESPGTKHCSQLQKKIGHDPLGLVERRFVPSLATRIRSGNSSYALTRL